MPNPNEPDDAGLNLPPLVHVDDQQRTADAATEQRRDAEAREWTRIAHDALHDLEAELAAPIEMHQGADPRDFESAVEAKTERVSHMLAKVHDAVHAAVQDDPPPAETAATDLRPFDRAFASLAREHGVAAVWVAAHPNGHLHSGGHVELNTTISAVIQAGMQTMGGQSPEQDSGLILPASGRNGSGLIVPGQG